MRNERLKGDGHRQIRAALMHCAPALSTRTVLRNDNRRRSPRQRDLSALPGTPVATSARAGKAFGMTASRSRHPERLAPSVQTLPRTSQGKTEGSLFVWHRQPLVRTIVPRTRGVAQGWGSLMPPALTERGSTGKTQGNKGNWHTHALDPDSVPIDRRASPMRERQRRDGVHPPFGAACLRLTP